MGRDIQDLSFLDSAFRRYHGEVFPSFTESDIYAIPFDMSLFEDAVKVSLSLPDGWEDGIILSDHIESIIDLYNYTSLTYSGFADFIKSQHSQIAKQFSPVTKTEPYQENSEWPDRANKVAAHAVRIAADMTYRDAIRIIDALARFDKLSLGIMVCRMHWYPEHWWRVRKWLSTVGKDFVNRMKAEPGLFGYLMESFALL